MKKENPLRNQPGSFGANENSLSRRGFLKRSGGATIASALTWQMTLQKTCADESSGMFTLDTYVSFTVTQELQSSATHIDDWQSVLDAEKKLRSDLSLLKRFGGAYSNTFNPVTAEFFVNCMEHFRIDDSDADGSHTVTTIQNADGSFTTTITLKIDTHVEWQFRKAAS